MEEWDADRIGWMMRRDQWGIDRSLGADDGEGGDNGGKMRSDKDRDKDRREGRIR